MCLEDIWIVCSTYDKFPKLNSHRNGGGGIIRPFNEHEILHINNVQDIHMSSSFYEESGKSLSLDLKTISYQGIVYIMDHELIDRRPLLSENM